MATRARAAGPEGRARLWTRPVGHHADFAGYRSWTDPEIPVVAGTARPIWPGAG